MSLLRLLTTGRSLVGLSDSTRRYRITHRRLLPKFGTGENPFATQGRAAMAQTREARLAGPSRAGIARYVNRWTARFDAWLSRPRSRPAKAAIPQFSRAPVQGELKLDQIKVVRNDLSDSDLEVVPAKPRAAAEAAAPVLTRAESLAAAGTTWGRMATRLFGAGKT